MKNNPITLAEAQRSDHASFKKELQDAFAVAVVDEFGDLPDGPIPSDEVLDRTLDDADAVVLHILYEGRKIGGAVLKIDPVTHRNTLDLFFLRVGEEGRGLGAAAWSAIEQRYPETVSWQTHTPYFEKRNIHFYVNKCGFKIVEFFNQHHPDPNHPGGPDDLPGDGEAFQFEKIMKSSGPVL